MNSVTINGKTYTGSGSISINGDNVIIGGKDVSMGDEKTINITVTGDIEEFDIGYANTVSITGNVGKCKSSSGNIKVKGNISGDAQASSGDIEAEIIGGDVSTSSGDVRVREIKGKCKTISGDINS